LKEEGRRKREEGRGKREENTFFFSFFFSVKIFRLNRNKCDRNFGDINR
jgi:hypothetical protein